MPPLLILASASPRRRFLLEQVGYAVQVHPSGLEEGNALGGSPSDHVSGLAYHKARRVAEELGPDAVRSVPVLAADTLVHREGRVYHKPRDEREACGVLETLSGSWHRVTTGFAVGLGETWRRQAVTTRVRFRQLTTGQIRRYVASGDPLDKAGAYGIQGRGGALVAEVDGSYTNVVGLPLEELLGVLRELGLPVP